MKHTYKISSGNITLEPLDKPDLESLRKWRNNKKETIFLRPIAHITKEEQRRWFESYLTDKNIIIFSIFENHDLNRLVGSIAAYDFDKTSKCCEVGKLQIGDQEAHGKNIGYISMAMLCFFLLYEYGIEKVFAIVHEKNIPAYKSYLKAGFRIVGKEKTKSQLPGYDYKIEMTRDDFVKSNSEMLKTITVNNAVA